MTLRNHRAFVVLFLLVAVIVFAAPGSTLVFITRTGAKYHRESCPSLAKSKIEISIEDAVKRGYEPCKMCIPPEINL